MLNQDLIREKISTKEAFIHQLNIWRFKSEKIVFTNGCFDMLHKGHIDYLAKAADLGTKLIIGLNSDASTRRLKGAGRPITDEDSRSTLLAALFFVDKVILFEEDTPEQLIQFIRPDILVKGGDYTLDKIVGADLVRAYGGQVLTIPFLPGYSTSSIESRIRGGS